MSYVRVCADGQRILLRFASFASARQFIHFVNLYMDEGGAGNGSSAYWDAHWHVSLFGNPNAQEQLDDDLAREMVEVIAVVRSVPPNVPWCSWNHERGKGITFTIHTLPPARPPQVGEVYRIPRSRMSRNKCELPYAEGRVIRCEGDILYVQASHDELACRRRNLSVQPPLHQIKRTQVIRIPDWIADIIPAHE